MSKGSARRPRFVPLATFAENYERALGKAEPRSEFRSFMVETPTGGKGVIFDISTRIPLPSPGADDDEA